MTRQEWRTRRRIKAKQRARIEELTTTREVLDYLLIRWQALGEHADLISPGIAIINAIDSLKEGYIMNLGRKW